MRGGLLRRADCTASRCARDARYGLSAVLLEKLPDHAVGVKILCGATDQKLREVLDTTRPGVTTTFNSVKIDRAAVAAAQVPRHDNLCAVIGIVVRET